MLGQDTTQVDLIALRRQIGYVIQGAALFPHLTVADNIGYVPGLSGKQLSQERLAQLMKLVDLPVELLSRYPISLSGGQQQRVGIARALANRPPIMLMDEPFGAVDEITRVILQDSIQQLHRQLETTIVFVTHNIREALYLSDRVLILNHGQVQQLDTPEVIRTAPCHPICQTIIALTAYAAQRFSVPRLFSYVLTFIQLHSLSACTLFHQLRQKKRK